MASSPPTSFGMVLVEWSLRPGSSRSGLNATKRSSPTTRFFAAARGVRHHDREHFVSGGPGVGRRFEDDQLACAEGASDPLGGIGDVGEVRFLVSPERRRDRDDDHIAFAELLKIGRGLEPVAVGEIHDHLVAEVAEIILLGGDRVDLALVHVEADGGQTASVQCVSQRKADVAEADDADGRRVVCDLRGEVVVSAGGGGGLSHGISRWEMVMVRKSHDRLDPPSVIVNPRAEGHRNSS